MAVNPGGRIVNPQGLAPASVVAPPGVGDPAAGLNIIGNGPLQDPQTAAFYRASGQTEAEAYATALSKQAAIDRALQLQLPDYQLQLQKQLRDIGNSYLDKGTFNSGQRLYDQAFAQQQNQVQVNKAYNDASTQTADTQSALATALAQEQEKQAEQGLTGRTAVALDSAAANKTPSPASPYPAGGTVKGSRL